MSETTPNNAEQRPDRCEKCKFWVRGNEKHNGNEGGPWGYCHRGLRHVQLRNDDDLYDALDCQSPIWEWPVHLDYDWCGEWKPKEQPT